MKRNYVGVTQRTFEQAAIRLLETEYGFLNSRRVITMLVKDIASLVETFYPPPDTVPPGWMVFTGTRVTGRKAVPGRSAGSYPLATIAWPVLLPQDTLAISQMPTGNAGRQPLAALLRSRIQRVIQHGLDHPDGSIVLTTADLALMFGRTSAHISTMLKRLREETALPLSTKGYFFDQGIRPTHKSEIIGLYEQGLDEMAIAHTSNHAQSSVGHYIRDYERIALLLDKEIALDQLPLFSNMQPSVVKEHLTLVHKYRPHLLQNYADLQFPLD